jgi:hypothetical protein
MLSPAFIIERQEASRWAIACRDTSRVPRHSDEDPRMSKPQEPGSKLVNEAAGIG